MPVFIILVSQALFATSDLIGRYYMHKMGFNLAAFASLWFLLYFFVRMAATVGQLYVFTHVELGKTIALFGASSIILANILGFLFLQETLSPIAYVGVMLAITAIVVVALAK